MFFKWNIPWTHLISLIISQIPEEKVAITLRNVWMLNHFRSWNYNDILSENIWEMRTNTVFSCIHNYEGGFCIKRRVRHELLPTV